MGGDRGECSSERWERNPKKAAPPPPPCMSIEMADGGTAASGPPRTRGDSLTSRLSCDITTPASGSSPSETILTSLTAWIECYRMKGSRVLTRDLLALAATCSSWPSISSSSSTRARVDETSWLAFSDSTSKFVLDRRAWTVKEKTRDSDQQW